MSFQMQLALMMVLGVGTVTKEALGWQPLQGGGGEGGDYYAALAENEAESSTPVLDEISEDFKNISDDEWKKKLSPLEFAVCREAGTERPHTGKYNSFYDSGTFMCVCCGSALFSSESKFNSGSGWPSFHTAITNAIEERRDESHGMIRTEVRCAKCDAHLGHVFKDGPPPTGDRFCINSVCMTFKPKDNTTD